jgi:hypothetical protein
MAMLPLTKSTWTSMTMKTSLEVTCIGWVPFPAKRAENARSEQPAVNLGINGMEIACIQSDLNDIQKGADECVQFYPQSQPVPWCC